MFFKRHKTAADEHATATPAPKQNSLRSNLQTFKTYALAFETLASGNFSKAGREARLSAIGAVLELLI